MAREVLHTKTFASEAANFILIRAREALDTRGEFRIALSGGNTPRAVRLAGGAPALQFSIDAHKLVGQALRLPSGATIAVLH